MKKKVSIIIPVYNGEKYLKEAIDSALNQTYDNIEIIVVNDGSTDNTDNICKTYGDKIKYIVKENGGVSTALNVGIKNMTGDYFSWLSHDDLYAGDKIEKQIKFLEKIGKEDVILYSDFNCIDENGKLFTKPYRFDEKMLELKPLYALLRGCINGITLLIPKKAFDKCGLFDENLRCTQDYDLWWKMIKHFEFIHMNELITKTRIHTEQDTNTSPNVLKEGNPLWIKMIDDVSDDIKIQYENSIYNYYYEMAKYLLETPYEQARDYCINKCKEIDLLLYTKKPIKKRKITLARIISHIQNHGIKNTLKKVKRKLFR